MKTKIKTNNINMMIFTCGRAAAEMLELGYTEALSARIAIRKKEQEHTQRL